MEKEFKEIFGVLDKMGTITCHPGRRSFPCMYIPNEAAWSSIEPNVAMGPITRILNRNYFKII